MTEFSAKTRTRDDDGWRIRSVRIVKSIYCVSRYIGDEIVANTLFQIADN